MAVDGMITIANPNTDRSLITIDELRSAAWVSNASRDAELNAMGAYVSALITKACQVESVGAIQPTLRLETVSQTYRTRGGPKYALIAARHPVVAILSVTEGTSVLTTADYEEEHSQFFRLSQERRTHWHRSSEIVIEYSAGYATVPADLTFAAIRFVQSLLAFGDRDPLLKSRQIEGVSRYEWWVDPTRDSIVPAEVMDILDRGGYLRKWSWVA